MEFRILGPLEIHPSAAGGPGADPLRLAGPRQQEVLAVLLLNANTVVAVDAIIDCLWGDDPPRTARRQVQNQVSALRALLDDPTGPPLPIATHPSSYRLALDPDQLDAQRFVSYAEQARRHWRDGKIPDCAEQARAALGLWRGPALAGLHRAPGLAAEAARLEECRLDVLAHRIDADLAEGRDDGLIGELTVLTGTHPLRERFRAQLMTALYRCGRKADALASYDACRRLLVEEFGLDPGPRLAALRQAILTDDLPTVHRSPRRPAPVGYRAHRRPAQLPPAPADFVGRRDERRRLRAMLAPAGGRPGAARRLPVVTGQPGVGKTALAVRTCWDLVPGFPDGHLHLAQRGTDPADLLSDALRALGVPAAETPRGLAARAGLYRSILADRRVLILLDDATDPDQVRPLLPGTGPSAVLVTGSSRLAALEGADLLRLAPLGPAAAAELFARLAGAPRPADAAVDRIVGACEGVPALIRAAAAWAARFPDLGFDTLAEFVDDDSGRPILLGGTGTRAGIERRHDGLSASARTALRHLGHSSLHRFDWRELSTLMSIDRAVAERLLLELADAGMLETASASGGVVGYRITRMVRSFTRRAQRVVGAAGTQATSTRHVM